MILRVDRDLTRPEHLDDIVDGELYEFVGGGAVEKHMGAESDEIALALGSRMRDYALGNKLGRVYGGTTGFRNCFPHAPRLMRKPDVSFVAEARLPDGRTPRGDFDIAPDLAVEVVSPNDTYEEVTRKVGDYLQAAVKLIWVIDPATRTVLVRRIDGSVSELTASGTLSGEDVVPGFNCPVAELFV
jgi:Uma2 family endonuclease